MGKACGQKKGRVAARKQTSIRIIGAQKKNATQTEHILIRSDIHAIHADLNTCLLSIGSSRSLARARPLVSLLEQGGYRPELYLAHFAAMAVFAGIRAAASSHATLESPSSLMLFDLEVREGRPLACAGHAFGAWPGREEQPAP